MFCQFFGELNGILHETKHFSFDLEIIPPLQRAEKPLMTNKTDINEKVRLNLRYLYNHSNLFQTMFEYARLVLTVEIDHIIIAAVNLKVVPARLLKRNISSWEIILLRAAEKISDLTLKEILVIPCQEYNIHVSHYLS